MSLKWILSSVQKSDQECLQLLRTACQQVVDQSLPTNEAEQKLALEQAMVTLGEAITQVMPYEEFWHYTPGALSRGC